MSLDLRVSMKHSLYQVVSNNSLLRSTLLGTIEYLCLYISCFQALFDSLSAEDFRDCFEDVLVANVIECSFEVGSKYPFTFAMSIEEIPQLFSGIVATSSGGAKSTTVRLKTIVPAWL